jgi:hypothetical protein
VTATADRSYIDVYHGLLEDAEMLAASAAALADGTAMMRAGDRPLVTSLRPSLIPRSSFDAALRAANDVHDCLVTVEQAAVVDDDVRAELMLDAGEARLAFAAPDLGTPLPSVRLDGFLGDHPRFIENGGESTAGMAGQDLMVRAFDALPVMREYRRQFPVRAVALQRRQLDALMQAWEAFGGSDRPTIAIVDWEDVPTRPEFVAFADFFAQNGIKATICEPIALERRGDRVYADGLAIDVIYRRVFTSELLGRPDEAKVLVDAYLDGVVCVVNPFRGKLSDKKSALAVLSDPRFARIFSSAQRAAIARHVPWTRVVADRRTTRGEQEIDLLDHVLSERESLVLKPNDDYGGRGVILGSEVTAEAWEAGLTAATRQPYVVQEAVQAIREPFPFAAAGGGELELRDQAADFNPFVFHGVAHGAIARLSPTGLQNVAAGNGSLVPVYIVEVD